MKLALDLTTKKQLIEVGFLAAIGGNREEADTIFDGVAHMGNPTPSPYIGKALAALTYDDHEEALAILDKGLKALPEHKDEIKVFIAIVHHVTGKKELKDDVLASLTEKGGVIGALAQSLKNDKKKESSS